MLKNVNEPIITKSVNVIYDMSEDSKIREMARLREKALHNEASALSHARREGEQIGMEKGKEERANIAARLKELGLSDDMIKAALK